MKPLRPRTPGDDDIEDAYREAVDSLPDGYSAKKTLETDRPGITVEFFAGERRPRDRDTLKELFDGGTAVITVRGHDTDADIHPAEVEDIEAGLERIDAERDALLWRDEFAHHLDRLEDEWERTGEEAPVVYGTAEVAFSVERPGYHGWALGTVERAVRDHGEVHGYRAAIEADGPSELYEVISSPEIEVYCSDGQEGFSITYGPDNDGYTLHADDAVPDSIVDRLEENGLETL